MINLVYVTSNPEKLRQAKMALSSYPINLINRKIDIPEIQNTDCKIIAEYSAQFACEKIGLGVVATDAGYYIKSLKGFPGPFIKYVNSWLKPNDILAMMKGKKDRTVISPICLAYCEPGGKPISFITNNYGQIATSALGDGSTIDQLYIPKGYHLPIATMSKKDRMKIWNNSHWIKLAKLLLKKYNQLPALKRGHGN